MKLYDWNNYFSELVNNNKYTFTLSELKKHFQLSDKSVLQGLYRYKKAKKIIQIRKEFYGILVPHIAVNGRLSYFDFLDDLMKSLDKDYYVALLNAAALHGAAHQQPQVEYIFTTPPVPRNIKSRNLFFLSKSNWNQNFIVRKKTQTGYVNVSSPELTALDLCTYIWKFGVNRVTTILMELCEEMQPTFLKKVTNEYDIISSIQRLGYILEHFTKNEKLTNTVYNILQKKKTYYVPLSPKKEKKGTYNNKWKIIENIEIEPDEL
ncbi:MAG: type IV toxin-antitoxin system AbiEi family antitoxin [Bacteroidales bacterium]|jgi:predicted transcriptional regulator of viral defense system|nr:type IV toxin-antitoxin system AbiEi family antitoxin [Bacteroidales bacterium]